MSLQEKSPSYDGTFILAWFRVRLESMTYQKNVVVRIASGNSQGSQLLQACLQRYCDGPAKGESSPTWPPGQESFVAAVPS